VPIEYDPLLAKLSVWGETRALGIERMRRAVQEYRVLGVTTNLGLFARLMADERWQKGDLHTGFLDDFMSRSAPVEPDSVALVASVLAAAQTAPQRRPAAIESDNGISQWRAEGRRGLLR
jgi:acetyl-CoA carboxylase biotin carboxylase subunit